MKFVKYLAVLAMAVSLNVMAAMSPGDIGKLIDSGQLPQAESALQEVLKDRDTAKVHYMLAQVYQQMRRSLDAKNELATADSMDPAHSYTTNDKYQAQAAKILGAGTAVAPVARTSTPPQVQPTVAASEGPSLGVIFLWIFAVGAGIGLAYVTAMWFNGRKEKQRLKDELDSEITSLQSRAVRLVENVENAILNEKTSTKPSDDKVAALQIIKGKVLNVYDRAKNSVIETIDGCNALVRECQTLEVKLNTTMFMPSETSVNLEAEFHERRSVPRHKSAKPIKAAQQNNAWGNSAATQQQPAPQPQVIRETVVVNQGSTLNDVLVTSVLLDSMNHNHRNNNDDYDRQQRRDEETRRQRERDDEDRRERQRQADDDRQARESREEESRQSTWSTPSSDSGSSSSSWSDSSSSSSDSGSSSSDW